MKTIEQILKEYEINEPHELETILNTYDESCYTTVCAILFLKEKGLIKEFREFMANYGKESKPMA